MFQRIAADVKKRIGDVDVDDDEDNHNPFYNEQLFDDGLFQYMR